MLHGGAAVHFPHPPDDHRHIPVKSLQQPHGDLGPLLGVPDNLGCPPLWAFMLLAAPDQALSDDTGRLDSV